MTRVDTAERLVTAGPERAFAALVDPDALAAWLPPDGMTGRIEHFDLRPGGSYRMVLTYTDAAGAPGKSSAAEDVAEARFLEITPGVRVVQAIDFISDDPAYAEPMMMTWQVDPAAAGSLITIRAEQVPDPITPADHLAGMTASLANLARYLER